MKTFILNLFLLLVIVKMSGCSIDPFFDFSGLNPYGGYGNYNFNFTIPYESLAGIDSVVQNSEFKITIWGFIYYDSTLIIKSRKLEYWETLNPNNVIKLVIQSEPDTVNFKKLPDTAIINSRGRKEWNYKFYIPVIDLKKNVEYNFSLFSELQEKGNAKFINQSFSFTLK